MLAGLASFPVLEKSGKWAGMRDVTAANITSHRSFNSFTRGWRCRSVPWLLSQSPALHAYGTSHADFDPIAVRDALCYSTRTSQHRIPVYRN